MIMDKKGKLFSKVSIVDAVILLVVIGLAAGFIFRTFSRQTKQVISSNTKIYVTFVVEKVRDFSVDAVSEGDIFYEQHVGQALGSVKIIRTETARDLVKKDDGTAVLMDMEDKYDMYITLECRGNITTDGYYINGNRQVSVGSDVQLKSNMIMCGARVCKISETAE